MNWYLTVLKKYATFSGRAQRSEFWYFILFSTIASLVLGVLDGIFGTFNPESGFGLLGGIYSLAVIVPTLAVGARRLHDIGKSGWWQLIMLIPLVGIILLIVWWATDSKEDNQYGKNPKKSLKANNIATDNTIENIEKLASLKEKGILTEEEFRAKKQELLG